MADVTDRAQLLTVVGVVLAVTLVGTAMVANTVIFTENLATRETTRSMEDTAEYRIATNESLKQAINRINQHNPSVASHSTLITNFTSAVDTQERILQRDVAGEGTALSLSVVSTTEGTRLRQTDSSRGFTSNSGGSDWTLATDISETDRFTMNISRSSLLPATVDTLLTVILQNAYHIRVDNGSAVWDVYFFHGPLTGNVYTFTEEPGSSSSGLLLDNFGSMCAYNAPVVEVDMVQGTLNGTACPELAFFDDLEDPHSISYQNAHTGGFDRAAGTYDILVSDATVQNANFDTPPSQPFSVAKLTQSTVDLQYQTDDLEYRARLDVTAPSQTSSTGGGSPPSVTNLVVSDDTGLLETYDFDISADVADPDGGTDLYRVRFTITDDENRSIDSVAQSVSANGTVSHSFTETGLLDPIFDDDGEYSIQVTVIDDAGNSDSISERHFADGDDSGSPPILTSPDKVLPAQPIADGSHSDPSTRDSRGPTNDVREVGVT